ncbi:hypothetical protein [Stackebrandtia soli]|uniref:hypothetical protein n=1 Tax=Stackebrandtia soli TaxID=1892856 RepID=UPI0039ED6633
MRRVFIALCALALVAALPAVAHAVEVSDRPMAGTAFNGTVHAVLYHDDVVYSAGEFTLATDRGKRYNRSRVAAVGADGTLRAFAPVVDGTVYALETDGTYLYLAGVFARVGDVAVKRVARVSLADGTVDEDFDVRISGTPRALEVAGGRLYIGGDFNTVNGVARSKMAAVELSDGVLVNGFVPVFDRGVRAIKASGSRIYVGGGFTTVGGRSARELVALTSVGTIDSGFAATAKGTVYDIDVASGQVYTAAGGPGGRVHAYRSDGSTAWERTADGDVVAVTVHGGVVYAGGHFEKVCKDEQVGDKGKCLSGVSARRGKLFASSTSGTLLGWNPDTDTTLGVLTMDDGGGTVAAGGTFLTFAGRTIAQRALALFGG